MFDDASLERMLHERSGLPGLSGISGDIRLLQDKPDPRAVAAVEHFVYAVTEYAGAYAAVLVGLANPTRGAAPVLAAVRAGTTT